MAPARLPYPPHPFTSFLLVSPTPLLCHLTRHVRSSLIKLSPDDAASPTFSPLSVTTALTTILIIPKRERQRVLWRIYLRSSGGKQGCLLSPALFGIFSSLLLSYVFDSWRSVPPYSPDGKLFNVALLRTKTKVKTVLVRDLLFADAALARHFEAALQRLITKLASAFINFGLKISLEKTNVSAMSAMPLKSKSATTHSW